VDLIYRASARSTATSTTLDLALVDELRFGDGVVHLRYAVGDA
jgi:hypothetical protein